MRIKGDWGNDDFASMEEVVRRYFRRRRDEQKPLPDLAVIDGGKGQLSAATSALASLEIEDVAVIALAKREEEVFVPGSGEPILLDRSNRALHLRSVSGTRPTDSRCATTESSAASVPFAASSARFPALDRSVNRSCYGGSGP